VRSPGKPSLTSPWPIVAMLIVTAIIVLVFVSIVDLTPQVEQNFFFSKKDPQVRADNEIVKIFPESSQIILAAAGNIESPAYVERIRSLSAELSAVPGVTGVESLTNGPKNVDEAFKSALWTRVLIPDNRKSTYLYTTLAPHAPVGPIVRRLKTVQRRFDRPGFRIMISGEPYITELFQGNLSRDLRVFNLTAFCVFGLVLFVIFRSPWILLGTLVACIDSGATALIATQLIHIPIGPLTANLSTMVFVMTMSPIVFLTFNWQSVRGDRSVDGRAAVWEAVKRTVRPSFWSSVCMFLGFISLLLVPSTPMRNLGIAGAIGAAMAFLSAYVVYPWFLEPATVARRARHSAGQLTSTLRSFFSKRHDAIVAGLAVFTVIGACGLPRLNTDPELTSYFKKGGEIRTGLDYVDSSGGSSDLKLVVEDKDGAPLNHKEAYERLWALQRSLEQDRAVGNVMSYPVLLSEARRVPLAFLFSTEKLTKILDEPNHGAVAREVINPDRRKTLFVLRMRETDRRGPRRAVIERLRAVVARAGFKTVLTGGTYDLLDEMSREITSSIISGVLILIGIFVVMGYAFSRSFKVSAAMLVSLFIIPVIIRGYIAWVGMPLDFMTASAANLDLGMGVDAMIYLTLFARREGASGGDPWAPWSKACSELWKPIGTSLLVLCSGFGIFLLSTFPPTQHFGVFVMLGSATAATAALFMFPWLASLSLKRTPHVTRSAPPPINPRVAHG
jgi:predicted RND superfamily exporter protein